MGYVITIGRSYGSGGRTMGKLLAEELGLRYCDRELLRIASDKSGINEELFGQADERVKQLSKFFRTKKVDIDAVPAAADSESFVSDDNLFRIQAEVIRELAKEGDCVIVGRCANYILRDDPNVIKLFCYSSLENCVEREKALSGMDEKEIVKKIQKIDKNRAEYYKYYTGQEWNAAENYDLCLNTASMTYEQLIKVVKAYIEEFNK